MIATIFRPKRRRNGKLVTSRLYRGRYRLHETGKIFDVALGTTDKRVARQKLEQIIREQELKEAGLLPQKPEQQAAQVPLKTHLEDYERDLLALKRDPRHVLQTRCCVRRLMDECGWNYASDINADSFQTWRAKQVLSPKTLNGYLVAVRALLNWMERLERIEKNPLAKVQRIENRGATVRKRRAFTDDEISRLITAVPERKVIYLTAVYTGLRRGELEQLRWGDLHLDAPKPFFNVRAFTTKSGKQAVIVLHPDVVTDLRTLEAQPHEPGDSVLASLMPTMDTFRADLKKAGIEYVNAQGHYADFHALRHTLATNLARAGVAPRVAMEVMRHSDMSLTTRTYTDVGLLPTADVADVLPSFTKPRDTQQDSQKPPSHGQPSQPDANSPETSVSPAIDYDAVDRALAHLDKTIPHLGKSATLRPFF